MKSEMSVCKEFKFSYGHYLPGHKTCHNQHGHNARMLVTVRGPIKDTGMVIDFKDLKEIVLSSFVKYVDHKNLNDVPIVLDPPTVEHLCLSAFQHINNRIEEFNRIFKFNLVLEEVVIYETDGAYAYMKRPKRA